MIASPILHVPVTLGTAIFSLGELPLGPWVHAARWWRKWPGGGFVGVSGYLLGGGFKDFLFSPLFGEMIQFD